MLDGGGLWRAARAEVAQVMTPANVNAWLATTRALDQDGAVLRVAVPAPFNKVWLDTKLADRVAAALRKIDGNTPGVERVEYVVQMAACAPAEGVA